MQALAVYYRWLFAIGLLPALSGGIAAQNYEPAATRRFEVRDERPYLGGQRVDLWGIRCGNALRDDAVTERHIRCFDNFIAHGINCIGVYVQGSNPGWPNLEATRNGYTAAGDLKPEFARRLRDWARTARWARMGRFGLRRFAATMALLPAATP
jgi:hypothetical protein